MKKRKAFAGLFTAFALMLSSLVSTVPAMADAMRVVTLGADLSDEQKQRMLNYFKVNKDEVRIIYVTNADERSHLGSYVPLEQIGTRTVSCAYVRPTTSGGIKVRCANLNWVTANMIAASLSTSGVSNCEVIAACPFEVSGTGALTGVQMAYEAAVGSTLDAAKKEVATEEMVVTGNLADNVGQNEAINVINKAKMEVIANDIQSAEEIYNTVINIINQNNVEVSQEELDAIVTLLEDIAAQQYDYQDMMETLEMVDGNVSQAADDEDDIEDEDEDGLLSENDPSLVGLPADDDSIFNDINEEVLGEEVVVSATDEVSGSGIEEAKTDAPAGTEETAGQTDDGWDFVDTGAADSTVTDPVQPEAADQQDDQNVEMQPADSQSVDMEPVEGQNAEQQPADSQNVEQPAENTQSTDEWGLVSDDGWTTFDTEGQNISDTQTTEETVTSDQEPEGSDQNAESVDQNTESSDQDTESSDKDKDEWDEWDTQDTEGSDEWDVEESGTEDSDDASAAILESDPAAKQYYEKLKLFCKGLYEGDSTSLQQAIASYPSYTYTDVTLDSETGSALTQKVLSQFLSVLGNGSLDISTDSDYSDPVLAGMDKALQKIFGQGDYYGEEDAILEDVDEDDLTALYEDTMDYLEELYGESGASASSMTETLVGDSLSESGLDDEWDVSTEDTGW